VPLAEDDKVEVVVDGPDDFLGVGDLGFELLCEAAEGAVEEGPEEDEFVEYFLVGLAQVADSEVLGEFLHEFLVLLEVEVLLHLG